MRARVHSSVLNGGVAAAFVAATLIFAAAWSVTAATAAAVAAPAAAGGPDGAGPGPVIDTAAPIDKTSCAPCHLDLGAVDVPGLIFSHGNHLLVSCDACHSRMPHRGGNATERVPMEVCFACHGVNHGEMGELATSRCEDCHTPAFRLRPRSHARDWAKTPHAEVSRASGVNSCMMCHGRAGSDAQIAAAGGNPALGLQTRATAAEIAAVPEKKHEPACVSSCPAKAMRWDTRANILAYLKDPANGYYDTASGWQGWVGSGSIFWASRSRRFTPPKADPFIEDHVAPMASSILSGSRLLLPTLFVGGLAALSARRSANEEDASLTEGGVK